jgi:apolipoprotein N-acyltransferase
VFRAIENRRAVVRSANTGVSCFIDPNGHIYRYVQNDKGKKTYVDGVAVDEVILNPQETFYARYGDIFTILCFGILILVVLYRQDSA